MDKNELLKLINSTGWQSWCTGTINPLIKFPRYDYPPVPYTPQLDFSFDSKLKPPAIGWCSWPSIGTNVSEKFIRAQVDWLKSHPKIKLDYILIDDGWTAWGDWLYWDKSKFPSSISSTLVNLNQLGYKTGLWLAPFLAHPNSQIVQDHPDWFIPNFDGLKLTNFNKFPIRRLLLDVQNPKVRDYLREVWRTLIIDYKVELLKLDFLYAVYFTPGISPENAENILRELLLELKTSYPHVYTIACGCPIAPALGTVDSMRITCDNSFDVSLPKLFKPVRKTLNLIYSRRYLKSLHHALNNRLWMGKYLNLDLDTFICNEIHGFSKDELDFIANEIIRTKGNIFLGDDLSCITEMDYKNFIVRFFN